MNWMLQHNRKDHEVAPNNITYIVAMYIPYTHKDIHMYVSMYAIHGRFYNLKAQLYAVDIYHSMKTSPAC